MMKLIFHRTFGSGKSTVIDAMQIVPLRQYGRQGLL